MVPGEFSGGFHCSACEKSDLVLSQSPISIIHSGSQLFHGSIVELGGPQPLSCLAGRVSPKRLERPVIEPGMPVAARLGDDNASGSVHRKCSRPKSTFTRREYVSRQ